MKNELLPGIFTNYSGEMVVNPRSHYGFEKREPEYEKSAKYIVQEDPTIKIPDLSWSLLDNSQYRYVHGYNTAATLAAIKSLAFPGANNDGIAYPFEYSVDDSSRYLNDELAQRLVNIGKEELEVIEIGGQEGRWLAAIQCLTGPYAKLNGTIIDLDHYRRTSKSISLTTNLPKRVQADAHHLSDLARQHFVQEQPDAVLMINVSDVLFDPFSIFEQAWEVLKDGGMLVVADSFYTIHLPFTVFLNNNPYIPPEYVNGKQLEYNQQHKKWLMQNRELTDLIGDQHFSYDSEEDQNHEYISKVTRKLYDFEQLMSYSLSNILCRLGYKCDYLSAGRGYNYNGRAHVLYKNESLENPFRLFKPLGISRNYFHVDEYVFPQIHRGISADGY